MTRYLTNMLSIFIGNKEEFSVQHRIFNAINFSGIILTIITGITNYTTGLNSATYLFSLFSLLMFSGFLYYSLKKKNLYLISRIGYSFILFIYYPVFWFINGGLEGGFQYFTMFFLVVTLITMPGRKAVFTTLYFLIIITLAGVEYYFPELVMPYPSQKERFIDIIISYTLSYFAIILVINIFIKLYQQANNNLTKQKEQLETIRAELRKSNDELLEMNKAKDKFFSIIAHDLRNPFNSLLGFSNLLLENHKQYDDKERGEMIEMVNRSATGAFNLLENLLTWSRSQSGRIKYRPERTKLKPLVAEIISEMAGAANLKEIRVLETVDENDQVFADKNMISIVLLNLISNAIKFTNRMGDVIVETRKEKYSNQLTVSVTDTGVGISKEGIDNLFQIDKNRSTPGTENETGTGLGLIICKEFIEKHSGRIWVKSQEGQGAKFIFSLPQFVD